MAKEIDFSKVPVEIRIGEPTPTDMRRSVGNAINRNTSDIALADFARKVFYSEAPVEVPLEYVTEISQIVTRDEYLLAPAKMAVLQLLQGVVSMPATSEEKANIKPLKRKKDETSRGTKN